MLNSVAWAFPCLASSRIGIIGGWLGMDRTGADFLNARFGPAVATDGNGVERNFLDLLTEKVGPWEVKVLERTQAAADAGLSACMAAAVAGARYRDVLRDGKYASERDCTEARCRSYGSRHGAPSQDGLRYEFLPANRTPMPGDILILKHPLGSIDPR